MNMLSALHVPAQARDHFIDDEKCAGFAHETLQLLQEIVARRIDALGLENEASDLARMLSDQRFDALDVVIAKLDREITDGFGNAAMDGSRADEPIIDRE